ncbi:MULTISPECIES: YlcI/YnfO family protein [Actinosynnema]|uniref:YlcI/YnfO family protein n=1 Tax=Actinosynnema TaxID=40566 RepID=UPI0020A3E958|nr:YlcI/YnfO family protein [Actinosynnema pretiosum]MCP2097212.1 Ribbon-helix-helix protein, copG family [Actinosynnema pretiosum]
MDLTTYVGHLGREFAALADAGGEEARALAERLTGPLESAIRMAMLEALSAAADEITRELAPGSVEVRLRGRDPDFVVTPPPADSAGEEPAAVDAPAFSEDGPTARINVRLPEQLKAAVEEAAAREGRSVNAWLVRAATDALRPADRQRAAEPRGKRGGSRFSGWVR